MCIRDRSGTPACGALVELVDGASRLQFDAADLVFGASVLVEHANETGQIERSTITGTPGKGTVTVDLEPLENPGSWLKLSFDARCPFTSQREIRASSRELDDIPSAAELRAQATDSGRNRGFLAIVLLGFSGAMVALVRRLR